VLVICGMDARRCLPEQCYMWTWHHAEQWVYARVAPVPAHELVVRPGSPIRCRRCSRQDLRCLWQTFSGGRKQLRCECAICGGFVRHLSPPPGNLHLEYRALP
jgi:hypothetical protein